MKVAATIALCLMLATAAGPVTAQVPDVAPDPDGAEGGMALIERGMRSILDGLFAEMEPAIGEMGRALAELRPLAEDLIGLIDEVGNYEAPVLLENGDILIRRKTGLAAPLNDGEVEL